MQVKAISACPDTDSATVAADAVEVFDRLYAENYVRVRRFLWSLVRNWDLADELAQKTFVTLWERMSDGRVSLADPEHVFGFLAHLAKWVLASHYRASQRRPEYLLSDPETPFDAVGDAARATAPSDVDLVDARVRAGQIIAALPQDYRRVLALHLLEDLSVAQVASQTGLTVVQVRAAVAEGLRRLRTELGVRQDVVEQADVRRREQVLRVYRESVEAGRPLTLKAIADRFGVSATWVEKTVRQDRGTVVARRCGTGAREAVRTGLRSEILAGIHTPGTRMPPGAALAPRWDTSARTVNQALHDLVAEGVLIHEQHRFVVPSAPGQTGTPTPRQRVMTRLRAEILSGTYPSGTNLPAVIDLVQALNVSETAIRDACADLVAQGLLIRHGGRRFQVAATPPARIPAPRRSPENSTRLPVPA